MMNLTMRDQLLVCVADTVNYANPELEVTPGFEPDSNGTLTYVAIRPKNTPQKEIRLNVEYDNEGLICKLGNIIPINTEEGLINYNEIHSKLAMIIPQEIT